MPDCPEGAAALQVPVQVQGWAVGGERAQGPAMDMRGREDAAGPTVFMHEPRQRVMLLGMTQHTCFPSLLLVKDLSLDGSVSIFHAHTMEMLNLTCLIALM